jgi:Uncharacterized conserved protein
LSLLLGYKPYYVIDKDTPDESNHKKYDFLKWTVIPQKGSSGFRLPTEAEWEYAARGGKYSQGYKYAGSDTLKEVGWYGVFFVNSKSAYDADIGHLPVGLKQSNELGLYDMSGNVWECCWDWYDRDYYKNSPIHHPQGATSGEYRVLRGGSWFDNVNGGRVALRNNSGHPDGRGSSVGFRLTRDLTL